MVRLLGVTLQEIITECKQNGGCDQKMNLQVATKFECGVDRKNSESGRECWNGLHRQDDGLNEPLE